jgi:hypothetical protein
MPLLAIGWCLIACLPACLPVCSCTIGEEISIVRGSQVDTLLTLF